MKLLLIEPANRLAIKINKIHILENLAHKSYLGVPPLALGVLAGLTPPDWEIKIIREPTDKVDFDEDADLIGITAATHTVNRGYEIADNYRARGKKVIMGGIHPTVMPEEALQHCDSVCIGEAENVWKKVLEDLKRGKLKKMYKQQGFADLTAYIPPRRDLFPRRKSIFFNAGTVETARGCPYNCEFCSVSFVYGKKMRYRPIDKLVLEIESIENNTLFFVDDNIVSNFQRAKRLFREMAPLRKRWAGQSTISIAKDRELLKLASASGCFGLLIGIESVVKEGFEKYTKSVKDFAELKEALKILKDHGIGVLAHMVFGNDFDTKETMKESLERLLELDVATATLGILVPYPGTRLALDLDKQKRILSKDWDWYDIHHLVFRPKNFTCENFLEEIQNIRKKFFSVGAILSRALNYRSPLVLGINISSRSHNRVSSHLES